MFTNEADYWDAMSEEQMGYQGDPRRCPRHPNVITSSPDGMIDGLCGDCEYGDNFDSDGYDDEVFIGVVAPRPTPAPVWSYDDIPF